MDFSLVKQSLHNNSNNNQVKYVPKTQQNPQVTQKFTK